MVAVIRFVVWFCLDSRERNRVHARNTRERKKSLMDALQCRIQQLIDEVCVFCMKDLALQSSLSRRIFFIPSHKIVLAVSPNYRVPLHKLRRRNHHDRHHLAEKDVTQ